MFFCTLPGDFLPVQLIYKRRTTQCHPKFQFLLGWHVIYASKDWSTEQAMIVYIYNIIFPYVQLVRELKQDDNASALVIMVNFKGQVSNEIHNRLVHRKNQRMQLKIIAVISHLEYLWSLLKLCTISTIIGSYLLSSFVDNINSELIWLAVMPGNCQKLRSKDPNASFYHFPMKNAIAWDWRIRVIRTKHKPFSRVCISLIFRC